MGNENPFIQQTPQHSRFTKKYGNQEDEATKEFHRNRRMFCIRNDELVIAQPNLPYSHADWFEEEGWLTVEDDSIIDTIPRGVVLPEGNICFYLGYDFHINDAIWEKVRPYIPQLVSELQLNPDLEVWGGLIKQPHGTPWPPRIIYGKIRDFS